MSLQLSEQRKFIRQKMRVSRQALTTTQQQQASAALLHKLISHPKIKTAQRISVTLAHDGEIDLHSFIAWCWQQQKQIYLPVIHPILSGQLLFLEYQHSTEMIKNRYAITEPKLLSEVHNPEQFQNASAVTDLDIICTPLVAFDEQGNRIGMGGGYYDRLLAPWFKNKSGPYPIGLAHDCQYIKTLPTQHWDVPLPEIITPSKNFYF